MSDERRSEDVQGQVWPNDVRRNDLARRVDKIEKQLEEYPPAVLFDRMIRIADEVKYLKRALWGVVFSVVTAVITYLLTLRLGVEIQPR